MDHLGEPELQWTDIVSGSSKIGGSTETLRHRVRRSEREERIRSGPRVADRAGSDPDISARSRGECEKVSPAALTGVPSQVVACDLGGCTIALEGRGSVADTRRVGLAGERFAGRSRRDGPWQSCTR